MTISGYSNAIVDLMLGWLKGLANWVLRLFNLAGSASSSPLLWLSHNWLKLLIFFLVLGIVIDLLVWLIRWRPYWVWFRKERVIVNDEKFFASADMDKAPDWERHLNGNWDEHDYVVASTLVRRKPGEKSKGAVVKNGKRPERRRPGDTRRRGTKVEKRVDRPAAASPVKRAERPKRAVANSVRTDKDAQKTSRSTSAPDNIFAVKLNKPEISDRYEDEVFNVSNLPVADEFSDQAK